MLSLPVNRELVSQRERTRGRRVGQVETLTWWRWDWAAGFLGNNPQWERGDPLSQASPAGPEPEKKVCVCVYYTLPVQSLNTPAHAFFIFLSLQRPQLQIDTEEIKYIHKIYVIML